jgi:hypothetical protein
MARFSFSQDEDLAVKRIGACAQVDLLLAAREDCQRSVALDYLEAVAQVGQAGFIRKPPSATEEA